MNTAPIASAIPTAAAEPSTVISSERSRGLISARHGRWSAILDRAPAHQQTQEGTLDTSARKIADDLALVEHQDAVAQVQHLVQIERDHQHAPAFVSLVHDLLVDELDRADVQS